MDKRNIDGGLKRLFCKRDTAKMDRMPQKFDIALPAGKWRH
jgi:hypothetical protein